MRSGLLTRRVLITGGAGFIGHHLARRMLEDGWAVTVLDNESTGRREDVPDECDYVFGDVNCGEDLDRAFEPTPDVVFHVAGQASNIRCFDNPTQDIRANLLGTTNVVEKCVERKVRKLVYAGSMTAYGEMKHLPVREDAPLRPISYYGIGKAAAERFVLATARRTDLPFRFSATVFRMFNVYGPGQSLSNPYQGVLAIFIGRLLRAEPCVIYSDGRQTRDLVFIDDVTRAWAATAVNGRADGEAINLASGRSMSVLQMVESVCRELGMDPGTYPMRFEAGRPGDQVHTAADIAKAARVLEWRPMTAFEEGLRTTIDWAQAVSALRKRADSRA